MKRKTPLGIAIAAAVAAIVVLTTGAAAGTPGRSGRSSQLGDPGATWVSCLASHGVQVPSNDPSVVKPWLANQQNDPAVQAALQACTQPDVTDTSPTPAELVTCLEQHGIDVPSDAKQDPGALKQWLGGAIDQPSLKAALDECTSSPAPGGQKP
jgi:hypothetical protein